MEELTTFTAAMFVPVAPETTTPASNVVNSGTYIYPELADQLARTEPTGTNQAKTRSRYLLSIHGVISVLGVAAQAG